MIFLIPTRSKRIVTMSFSPLQSRALTPVAKNGSAFSPKNWSEIPPVLVINLQLSWGCLEVRLVARHWSFYEALRLAICGINHIFGLGGSSKSEFHKFHPLVRTR
jgi:hypothetical protein